VHAWPVRILFLLTAAMLVIAPPLFETGYYWEFYIPAAEIAVVLVAFDLIVDAVLKLRTKGS